MTGNPKGWGIIKVGDRVTNQGRHGVGQPPIQGRVIDVGPHGLVTVELDDDGTKRFRSISSLRKVTR